MKASTTVLGGGQKCLLCGPGFENLYENGERSGRTNAKLDGTEKSSTAMNVRSRLHPAVALTVSEQEFLIADGC